MIRKARQGKTKRSKKGFVRRDKERQRDLPQHIDLQFCATQSDDRPPSEEGSSKDIPRIFPRRPLLGDP